MTHAEVHLWGRRIGVISLDPVGRQAAVFEYDPDFAEQATGIEPAPLKMKRGPGLFTFPDAGDGTFHGLPGMFVDSLPDRFGTSLLDRWFAENGRNPDEVNTVERLLYMADRGMGALTYRPERKLLEKDEDSALDLTDLTELANLVTARNEALHESLADAKTTQAALDLIRVGTSAGGARAKAVVAEDEHGLFHPGHLDYEGRHRYWLLKFDGITQNADRDRADPPGMTVVEYIYSLIARRAGIRIPETRLLESGDYRHFLIERFDRPPAESSDRTGPDRLHYGSWCGLAHAHRDWPGAFGYEQLALVCRQLGLPHTDLKELYRRAVYNIVGVNHDDHTKNFGFLMDRRGRWRLSPAFDLTYACDPSGRWTKNHQTSLNGKTAEHNRADLETFASHCNLSRRDAREIIGEVLHEFSAWESLAREYEVPADTAGTISTMQQEVCRGLEV